MSLLLTWECSRFVVENRYQSTIITSMKKITFISVTLFFFMNLVLAATASRNPMIITTEAPFTAEVPEYSYEALTNGTIRFRVHNTASNLITCDLIREGIAYPQNGEIITAFSVALGSTFTYIDDDVLPGKEYRYIFEYQVEGTSGWTIHFDTITVISTIPALGNFNLIAAAYDDEYEVLHDGYTIVIDNTNIKADANDDLTGSVVFYLNGKRSIDNTFPFSLFGDVKGDYKKGRLKDGDYSLMAIAYPLKNGKGIAGDTASVSFSVNIIYEDEKVTIYPNPLKGVGTIDVQGSANAHVTIHLLDLNGMHKRTLYEGFLDDAGFMSYPLSSMELKKGVYVISIDVNDKLIQKRLIVE